jgi:cell cycle sensor histidine kinase DivJ
MGMPVWDRRDLKSGLVSRSTLVRRVSMLSSLRSQVNALVHCDALSCPVERSRHQTFIAARLALSLAAIGVLPPYLTYHGLPAPWEALAFGWLVLPLAAAVHVSRTGRLVEAQAVCLASILGLVVTMTLGGASGAALAWLLIVPFEALIAGRAGLIMTASAGALLVALGFAAANARGADGAAWKASILTSAVFVAPGIVYAGALALGLRRSSEVRRAVERAANERYRALLDVVGDSVLVLDRFGAVTSTSRETQMLFGFSRHDLVGRGLFDRIHVADRPAFLKAIADAALSAEPGLLTLRLRSGAVARGQGEFNDPVFAWVELRLRRSAGSSAAAIIAVVRDVTSLKTREEDLEAARLEAERNNAWKDRFLANVSHELRTPLNAIIGFAEMLATEQLAPKDPVKQREYARIIQASGQHLLAVVNTILDMSKLESGSFDIVPEPFEVAPLIDACCDMMRLKAEQAGVEVVRKYPSALPELVADKRACKQILINLLSNAVKFTPPRGVVTVGVRTEGDQIALWVHDTGIGIMARDLPRLGDPFFQAQGSYDRQYEGTGLGLSVVRGLVGLHGGTISIASAPGAGTSVTVRFPADCRHLARLPRGVARIDAVHREPLADPSTADGGTPMVKKIA